MEKISNAIIMAAGLGTRMGELTKETPKPLVKINGIPMIEKQINYLLKSNIENIYVVVGYKKEKFEYLEKKYPKVKLIYNEDFLEKNNISSIYFAKDIIKDNNCIICEADLYIDNYEYKNFVEKSHYLGYEEKGKDDWGFKVDSKNKITKISKQSNNDICMMGISYWKKDDINIILRNLEEKYANNNYNQYYWDEIVNDCIKNINVYVEKIDKNDIIEIDTFNELCKVDVTYEGDNKNNG